MAEITLERIKAIVHKAVREELEKGGFKPLSAIWATEQEVMEVCGKGRATLYRAVESGRIHPNDVRPNPIGKGYLFRRSAIIQP